MNPPIVVDELLNQRLPTPIAKLIRRGINAKNPLERHQAAYQRRSSRSLALTER